MSGERAAYEAARYIQGHWPVRPRLGLILGTGLGKLAEQIEIEAVFGYDRIPHFSCPTVLGHEGRLVCGRLQRLPVVAMAGRCHAYEGYQVAQIRLPVRVMRLLGAAFLVVGNASGGLNPYFEPGQLMAITDHVNLMGRWASSPQAGVPSLIPCRRGVYDPHLIDCARRVARQQDLVLQRGVYVAVSGPNYETRAEYRAFRRLGGDVVGMSTVPEALAACDYGMRVLAISTITNVARPDAPVRTQAEQVVRMASLAQPRLGALLQGLIAEGAFGETHSDRNECWRQVRGSHAVPRALRGKLS